MTTRRSTLLALAAALLPFLALAGMRAPGGYPPGTGDHAQYVLHARALRDGREYADTGYLYSLKNPILGPRAYPPGLPATLLPFLGWGGSEGAPFRLLVALVTGLFLWTAGTYIARRAGLAIGVAVVLVGGCSLEFLHHATRVSSDVFFCALVWGVIALSDREGPWTWRRTALVTLLGALAVAFRSAGIALVPAAVLFFLLKRRDAGWKPLVPAAVWAGVFLLLNAWLPSAASYAEQMPTTLGGLIAAAVGGVLDYRHAFGAALLSPLPGDVPNSLWHGVGYLLALLGLVAAGWRWWRSFLACFAVFYVGVLLAFPMHVVRYAWPLAPLFLALVFLGFQQGLTVLRVPVPRRSSAVVGLAVLLAIGQVLVVAGAPLPEDPRDNADFRDLVGRLEEASQAGNVRLAVFEPRVMAEHTGLAAMGLFQGSPAEWIEELRAQEITHVVVGDLGVAPGGTASLQAAVAAHPEAFTPIHENASFSLHRFDPGPDAP